MSSVMGVIARVGAESGETKCLNDDGVTARLSTERGANNGAIMDGGI